MALSFDLDKALACYSPRADPKVPKAKEEREKIRRLFPMESWPAMRLEQYALGQGGAADTFCRLIEVGSVNIGHWHGGTAKKFIIYKHRDRPGWYYPDSYGDVQEAWAAVRAAFVEAFRRAAAGDWEAIDDISALAAAHMLKIKSLYVYFPDQLLTVLTKSRLQDFLTVLGRSGAAKRLTGAIGLNRSLLSVLRGIPELRGWTTHELSELLHVGCGFRKFPG
jgi:5-methylcytosine-specific restriction protein B